MCGIAGWYARGGGPIDEALIARQCEAIIHRGPDDCGYFIDGELGMGMRRLSIIDIGGGHQPIHSPDGRHVIVFNGEIYNHLDLRPELEARGYRFSTQSDTETLLAAYICWGDAAWLRLEGMFGVAIWDRQTRTLTLARDALGIKPLYISQQRGGIAFASELRSLTELPGLDFDIDPRAVHDFVRFGHVLTPRSIYRQVTQLEPGHVLRLGPSGDPAIHRFWKPLHAVRRNLSEKAWIEEMRERLLETVRKHMLSDVPVGAFLSGGVDSSAVTAAMMRHASRPVKAFTVGFPGNAIDETEAARAIAAHLGCEHIVLPVELEAARDLVPTIVAGMDEPLAASAVIPCWYVSRLAAEHVKVVLCGEGGDELFAGYKRQRNAQRMARWQPLIRLLGPAAGLAGRLPPTRMRTWNMIRQQIGKVRDSAALTSGFQRFLAGTQIATPDLRLALLDPDMRAREERSLAMLEQEFFDDPDWANGSMIEQFMIGDLTVHMPSALLPRLDRTSMAHSLEARVPFLTHDFVDWSLTVPTALKVKGRGKHILREAIRPWLPEGMLDRGKQGFQMPVADWFRGSFSDYAREIWHDSGIVHAGFFDTVQVERLFDLHRTGKANYGKLLYALTVFSLWWRGRVRG